MRYSITHNIYFTYGNLEQQKQKFTTNPWSLLLNKQTPARPANMYIVERVLLAEPFDSMLASLWRTRHWLSRARPMRTPRRLAIRAAVSIYIHPRPTCNPKPLQCTYGNEQEQTECTYNIYIIVHSNGRFCHPALQCMYFYYLPVSRCGDNEIQSSQFICRELCDSIYSFV